MRCRLVQDRSAVGNRGNNHNIQGGVTMPVSHSKVQRCSCFVFLSIIATSASIKMMDVLFTPESPT